MALAVISVLAAQEHRAAASGADGLAIAAHTSDAPGHSPQDAAQDDGQRWHVLLWTLLAAGGAAGVGLLLFLVRIAMGWTKPPPPQEDVPH